MLVIAASLYAVACSSCSVFQNWHIHRLILRMPQVPAVWAHIAPPVYEVRWQDETGQMRIAYVPSEQSIVISVLRGMSQPVLAFPLVYQKRMHPAGALYPAQLKNPGHLFPAREPDELDLDFEGGYIATLAETLIKAGFNPWTQPLERVKNDWTFQHADPWDLDPSLLALKLIDGTYSSAVFFQKSDSVEVSLPAPADWLPESPFVFLQNADGTTDTKLGDGLHTFYRSDQTALVSVRDGKAAIQIVNDSERQQDSKNCALSNDTFN